MIFSSLRLGILFGLAAMLGLSTDAVASTLFAVTSGSKLFRSTDGANWQRITELDGATIVATDPTNPSTVLVEANITGGISKAFAGRANQRSIFRSTDSGQTWTQYPLTIGFTTLAFAVGGSGTIYFASGSSNTFYRSVDGGNSFQAGGTVGSNVTAITSDPRQPGVVYATESGVSGAGIYKSTDDGKTFSLLSNKLGTLNMPLAVIFGVAVDTKNGSLYVAAQGTCANIVECGLFRSTDDGKTWSDVKVAGKFRNVVYDARTDTLYAGGQVRANPEHGTAVKSTDGGASWTAMDSGLTFMGAEVYLDANDSSTVYAGEPGSGLGFEDDQFSANAPLGGVFVSSNGSAWSPRAVDPSSGKVQDRVISFAALPSPGGSGGCGIGVPVITSVQSLTDFGSFPYFAAGSWLEIKGASLAGDKRLWTGDDFSGANAPTNLDGTGSFVNSKSAYVYYISSDQIDVQAPADPATGSAKITVSNCAGTSAPFTLEKRAIAPGLLAPASFHVGGVRTFVQYLVALFPDSSVYVGNEGFIPGIASRPARPGDRIITYGVGFGDVVPAIDPGVVVAGSNNIPNLTFQFGSTPATVEYAGLVPGNIGLYQFNVVVPDVPDGDQQITVKVNGVTVPQTVYLTVHR